MESLIVGLLFVVVVLLLVLIAMVGVNIYMTKRTYEKPEAPCYAGAMQPRFGLTSVDPDHPAYNALLSKLQSNKAKVDVDKKPTVGDGNYL